MNNVIPFKKPSSPLSAIDLVKSNPKLFRYYESLKNVVTPEEFIEVMQPRFNPDF